MLQFVTVFRRGAIGVFVKAAVKGSQVVKAGLKSDIRNGKIPVGSEHGLGCLNALVAQIIVECSMGMLFKQSGKMVFGKTDAVRNLFQGKFFRIVGIDIIEQTGKYFVILLLIIVCRMTAFHIVLVIMKTTDGKQDIEQQEVNGGFPKKVMGKIDILHFHQ